MHPIRRLARAVSVSSRRRRGELFRRLLAPTNEDLIVDLGGAAGNHFARVFPELKHAVIADVDEANLALARERHGFRTARIDGGGTLPFRDGECDIVFCSSVIEHVTGDADRAVALFKSSESAFRREARLHQEQFAREIRRVAKRYFVQTPNKGFFIEAHTWIPLIASWPTHWQWRVMSLFNRFWPRRIENPDWALLGYEDMQRLFPDARIYRERFWIFGTKSLIAVRA